MQVKPIKIFVFIFCLMTVHTAFNQTLKTKLTNAVNILRSDSQMANGIMSLYVIDRQTGAVVCDYNSRMGLSPASTQKIMTAATAYETLGKDFRYETKFELEKNLYDTTTSKLIVRGNGDPTFGSWRYTSTQQENLFRTVKEAILKQTALNKLDGFKVYINHLENNPLPGGYIWKDAGNYYGSGHWDLNWNENQYDIYFNTMQQGEVTIASIKHLDGAYYKINNYLKQGAKTSGDQSIIYSVPYSKEIFIYGTVPQDEKAFKVSGSIPYPPDVFMNELQKYIITTLPHSFSNITVKYDIDFNQQSSYINEFPPFEYDSIYTHYSPTLDSITYWFLKKSVNLYGEALIKTIAQKTSGKNGTDAGTEAVRNFWKTRGIPENELKMEDGSGLSPQNKITTHALVTALQYAKDKTWFPGFYDALPEYNNMKMKSGTIGGCKGFAGYTSKYIFAIIINNYNGTHANIVNKMYKVLDNLK